METMPKNIRQIGGREDRMNIYMEDYVSTYLRQVQQLQEEGSVAGLLVGSWQQETQEVDTQTKLSSGVGDLHQTKGPSRDCVFISGAIGLRQADLEGGRVCLSQEAWTEGYEALGSYFSGQELCGLFVCEGSCRRFRRQALFGAVRECFPDREALLYLITEEGEEIFYRILSHGEERLQGYYCYFERNESMQDYMIDHLPERRVEWELAGEGYGRNRQMSARPVSLAGKEGALGDPAENFRQKMRRHQVKGQARQRSSRGVLALCAAMAAVIFVSGLGLAYREYGGIHVKEILERLEIDSQLLVAVSVLPGETGEHYVGRQGSVDSGAEPGAEGDGSAAGSEGTKGTAGSVIVEEISGNVYPTEEDPAAESNGSSETPSAAEGNALESTSAVEGDVSPESASAAEGNVSPESTSAAESNVAPETTSAESVASQESEGIQEEQETLPVNAGMVYTVKAGDSLYSISRRFYGTDAMVAVIQQLNGLENADLIKEGQELRLP